MQSFRRLLAAVACLVVGAASFALSFVALRDVAVAVGAVPAELGWLVPIVIDGGMICGSAIIWSHSKEQAHRPYFPFFFVAALVVMSVVVNVNHAGPALIAKVIAALPPLILLGTLELVAAQGRRLTVPQAALDAVAAPASAPVSAPAAAASVTAASIPARIPETTPMSVPELAPVPSAADSAVLADTADAARVDALHPADQTRGIETDRDSYSLSPAAAMSAETCLQDQVLPGSQPAHLASERPAASPILPVQHAGGLGRSSKTASRGVDSGRRPMRVRAAAAEGS
jgi:hypothetical protein